MWRSRGLNVVAAGVGLWSGWRSRIAFCGEEGGLGSTDEWERLRRRLDEVRENTKGAMQATLIRSDRAAGVKFRAHDESDLFEVLVCLLGGLEEGELREVDNSKEKSLNVYVADALSSSSLHVATKDMHISVFRPVVGPFQSEFSFERYDRFFTQQEMDSLIEAYQISQFQSDKAILGRKSGADSISKYKTEGELDQETGIDQSGPQSAQEFAKLERELKELGVTVYRTKEPLAWEDLAGYDDVKKQIDDTLTNALMYPEIYDRIAKGTRKRYQSSRPRAVLFEGPPGCGKTTTGKILASQAGVPFVHVPVEAVMSRWYGESEKTLSKVLTTANGLGPALIFLDEVDALGASRDKEIHEASRRMLSVLLRHIDGMDGQQPSILIAATNRLSDLDAALLSRFDVIIRFDIPDEPTRKHMFSLYAKHLSEDEISLLGSESHHLSGRSILDVCKEAERLCAGRYIRQESTDKNALPTLDDYLTVLKRRSLMVDVP